MSKYSPKGYLAVAMALGIVTNKGGDGASTTPGHVERHRTHDHDGRDARREYCTHAVTELLTGQTLRHGKKEQPGDDFNSTITTSSPLCPLCPPWFML